jgi:hypothetical protein
MNAKLFKQLIKEAVREAVREEIGILLLEQKKQELTEGKTFVFNSDDVPSSGNSEVKANLRNKMGAMFGYDAPQAQSHLKIDPKADNPFTAFIEDAANNMTAKDIAGLKNLG